MTQEAVQQRLLQLGSEQAQKKEVSHCKIIDINIKIPF